MAQTTVAAFTALIMGWVGFGAALNYAPSEIATSAGMPVVLQHA